MKGTFLAFLLCLALALGGLGAAAHTLGTQGQGVEVSARPRQGDPAAAQGLVATQQAQYQPGRNRPSQWNGALLWDLTIPLDNPAASRTACTFHRGDLPAPNDRQGITLTFPHQQDLIFYGYGCTEAELRLGGTDADPRLAPLYADVASRTPPGETRTETVDPRQYLDCYPLQVTVNLANQETDYDWSVSQTARAQEAALQEAFQAFFAFPFAPDTRWAVTVSKEDRGGPEANAITQASIRPVGPDVALDCRWALGADAVYFTFAPTQGEAGSLPEVSQVPGGYGIYRLALAENQKGAFQADPDSLALVYPLDPQGGQGAGPHPLGGRADPLPHHQPGGGPHLRRGGHRRHDLPPDPLPAPGEPVPHPPGERHPGRPGHHRPRPAPAHRPADPGGGVPLSRGAGDLHLLPPGCRRGLPIRLVRPHPGGLPPRPPVQRPRGLERGEAGPGLL